MCIYVTDIYKQKRKENQFLIEEIKTDKKNKAMERKSISKILKT